jgi:hypothetical protein
MPPSSHSFRSQHFPVPCRIKSVASDSVFTKCADPIPLFPQSLCGQSWPTLVLRPPGTNLPLLPGAASQAPPSEHHMNCRANHDAGLRYTPYLVRPPTPGVTAHRASLPVNTLASNSCLCNVGMANINVVPVTLNPVELDKQTGGSMLPGPHRRRRVYSAFRRTGPY